MSKSIWQFWGCLPTSYLPSASTIGLSRILQSDWPKAVLTDLGKMEKMPGDIILLHMCTMSDNHMIYGSWDIQHDRQSFLSFWAISSPLSLLATQKIKTLTKWENILEILSLYICVTQMTIIWHLFPVISSAADRFFCPYGQFLPFYPTNKLKNQNVENI